MSVLHFKFRLIDAIFIVAFANNKIAITKKTGH